VLKLSFDAVFIEALNTADRLQGPVKHATISDFPDKRLRVEEAAPRGHLHAFKAKRV